MKIILKIALVCLVILVLTSSLINCSKKLADNNSDDQTPSNSTQLPSGVTQSNPVTGKETLKDYIIGLKRPIIVDFGSTTCVPCKMMVPVIEELQKNYKDKFETLFINVTQDIEKTREFGISVIPTQILFDATGKELFRHIGFFSTEEILKTFESYNILTK